MLSIFSRKFVGELSEISGEITVEWKINEFCSLPAEVDKRHDGPVFSFAGTSWQLRIYPNGQTENNMAGCRIINAVGSVGLYLFRTSSGPPILLEGSFGFKTLKGKLNPQVYFTDKFKDIEEGTGVYGFMIRSELLENKSDLLPSDVLTVVCKLKFPETADASSNTVTEKCSYCKSTLDAHEDLSSHQQTCMDKPIKCPECSDVVALKDCFGHKCQTIGAEAASEEMSHDFKTTMLGGDHSDFVVKVKKEESELFSILAA